jgi:hypothetical protein
MTDDQAPEGHQLTLAELVASLRPMTDEELAESARAAEADLRPWRPDLEEAEAVQVDEDQADDEDQAGNRGTSG